ncbi:hypothetical protein CRYUN_Cryun25bG0007600 [Craigia yunnanensis]
MDFNKGCQQPSRRAATSTTIFKKLPPGPWKLPVIGNMHQLISRLPHHKLRDLAKKYGPLMLLQLGEVPTIVVSSAEIAKEMRKICTIELLSANRVQSFQSIREEEVSDLIKSISLNEGSPINLSEKIFSLAYGITAKAALGKNGKGSFGQEKQRARRIYKVLKLISGMRIKLEKIHQASDRILENIVNEHKDRRNRMMEAGNHEQLEGNLVDVLLKLQQQGDLEFPLTNDHIKAVIQDMFGAGSESSATTVEWAMSEILKNPELMKKAQNDVRQVFDGRVNEAIKETLRLHPSAPLLIPRECSENCVINGYKIPAQTKVIVNAWAIGRDACYWEEAEKFQPDRFLDSSIDFNGTNFEYIPFGAGRRICPGISFALPNIEFPLANLLYHFDWKLPNEMKFEDLEMTESFGLTVRRKTDLFLIPIPY